MKIQDYIEIEMDYICAWHEIADKDIHPEGNLEYCAECDGFKIDCKNYFPQVPSLKDLEKYMNQNV